MNVLLLQFDGKLPNLALMRLAAHHRAVPFVRNRETLGFQRWIIGAYDKQISWGEWSAARYEPRRLTRRLAS